ncbi:putative polyamine aminopropyl transferase [Smittium mucronatum]|uniref:Putative polyamine aminopropyl transferase n=1 Tax=Smittium mucronatum TaxID=133383 RepID=A0A1R0H262_9FUNG|nr:putative polyamine aminopropyl transferase [Smittium mucronatum]
MSTRKRNNKKDAGSPKKIVAEVEKNILQPAGGIPVYALPRGLNSLLKASVQIPSTLVAVFTAYSLILTMSSFYKNGTRYLEPIFGNVIPYRFRFLFLVFCFSFGSLFGVALFTAYCLSVENRTQDFFSKAEKKFKQLSLEEKNQNLNNQANIHEKKELIETIKFLLKGRCLDISQYDHAFDTGLMFYIAISFDLLSFFIVTIPMRLDQIFSLSDWLGPKFGSLSAHISSDYIIYGVVGLISLLVSIRISYQINLNKSSKVAIQNSASSEGSIFGYAYVFIIFLGSMTFTSFLPIQPACNIVFYQSILVSFVGVIIKICMHYQISIDKTKALKDYNGYLNSLGSPIKSEDEVVFPKPSKISNLKIFLLYCPIFAVLSLISFTSYNSQQCSSVVTWKHNLNPDIQVLIKTESYTGWIEVVDVNMGNLNKDTKSLNNDPKSARVLRAGHSILGGTWKSTSESIYGVFYYFDALLYSKNLLKSKQPSALHIGLGAGISAKSHYSQGINVVAVEYDYFVAQAAKQYFDVPEDMDIQIQDGRKFVQDSISSSFDFIVHDIFSGGSLNSYMLSTQFINQTHRVLKPGGMLALNYVGSLGDTKTIGIIKNTLAESFKHIRLFTDSITFMDSIQNMVFFASDSEIQFDFPESIFQNSQGSIRNIVLGQMYNNEFDLTSLNTTDLPVVSDDSNPLENANIANAFSHWYTMRSTFPLEFWTNY